MKPEELLRRILAGQRANVRFADFIRLIEDFGWTFHHQRGSHLVYRHPRAPERLVLQSHKGEAKRYQIDDFLSLAEKYELESPYGE